MRIELSERDRRLGCWTMAAIAFCCGLPMLLLLLFPLGQAVWDGFRGGTAEERTMEAPGNPP